MLLKVLSGIIPQQSFVMDLKGYAGVNEFKRPENRQPDYKGKKQTADGRNFSVAFWLGESEHGKYISYNIEEIIDEPSQKNDIPF